MKIKTPLLTLTVEPDNDMKLLIRVVRFALHHRVSRALSWVDNKTGEGYVGFVTNGISRRHTVAFEQAEADLNEFILGVARHIDYQSGQTFVDRVLRTHRDHFPN